MRETFGCVVIPHTFLGTSFYTGARAMKRDHSGTSYAYYTGLEHLITPLLFLGNEVVNENSTRKTAVLKSA